MIQDPYSRPISNIVTYPVNYVRLAHVMQLKLYNVAMQETLKYIKSPVLAKKVSVILILNITMMNIQ